MWRSVLKHKGDEAVGAFAVFDVGLAQGGGECGFFNGDAVGISDGEAGHGDEKSGPVAEGEAVAEEADERACVRGMADVTIWARFDDRLIAVDLDVKGEVLAEGEYGVPAKGNSEENEAKACEKKSGAMKRDSGALEMVGEGDVEEDGERPEDDDEGERAAIFTIANGSAERIWSTTEAVEVTRDDFKAEPEVEDDAEKDVVERRSGKGQWEQGMEGWAEQLAVGGAGFVCAEGSAGIVDGGFGSFEQVAGDGGHGVVFGGVLLGFFHDLLFVDSPDDVVAIDADVATL